MSVGIRLWNFGPYAAGIAGSGLGAYAGVQAIGGAAAVQGMVVDWISSGEAALASAATQLIGRTEDVVKAINDATASAVRVGRATLQQMTKYPIFPIVRSAGLKIYAFNVAALAANPGWFVLNYNGPLSPTTTANRTAVWTMHGWKMATAPAGYQLDEFPYASTAQGGRGATGLGPAQATPVPALENLVQGGLLSALYRYSLKGAANAPFLVVPVPL